MHRIETDVLVIGGGAAGCMAAIEAAKAGVRVTMVEQLKTGRAGSTVTSGAGIAAVMGPEGSVGAAIGDSLEHHFVDTLRGGEFMSDPGLLRSVIETVPRLIRELETFGANFSKTADGRYIQDRQLGHSFGRTCTVVGAGPPMMDALRKEMLSRGVQMLEKVMVTRLFSDGDRITGAFGVGTLAPAGYLFVTPCIILCTGGATALYPYASANFLTNGMGFAMAYAVGAELAHMEFAEFTLIPKVGKTIVSTAGISPMMGLGCLIRNNLGERFFARLDPQRMERTTRARLVQGVYQEMVAGRGPCWNDPTPVPQAEFDRRIKEEGKAHLIYKLGAVGHDATTQPFEWVPALHTFLGGVVVDQERMSAVPGLYAAGEVATGLHGSSRLSANAISDCLVSGKLGGWAAALRARRQRTRVEPAAAQVQEAAALLHKGSRQERRPRYHELPFLRELRTVSWEHIAVVRNQSGLEAAAAAFADIRRRVASAPTPSEWVDQVRLLECESLALTGEMIARSAACRTESRGQHYRADYPTIDNAKWLQWVVLRQGADDELRVSVRPAPDPVAELAAAAAAPDGGVRAG